LPKDTTSKFAGLSSHYPFNAERQTGKLCIPTFKVFWSDSMRESWPGLRLWGRRSTRQPAGV